MVMRPLLPATRFVAAPEQYRFVLVRILRDCRELVSYSEGPIALAYEQAISRFNAIIPRVTGVGAYPGEGLELRMLRNNQLVRTQVLASKPPNCASQVAGTVGQAGACVEPPCLPGYVKVLDPVCLNGRVRCEPRVAGLFEETCPAADMVFSNKSTRCVPVMCPPGTERNERDECQAPLRPLPGLRPLEEPTPEPTPELGGCLDPQEVIAAQPCFHINPTTLQYEGPPDLVAAFTPENRANLPSLCLQLAQQRYFDQPLCDPGRTIPAAPSCLTPEQRDVLNYCQANRQNISAGPNRAFNWICWFSLKDEPLFQEWVRTADCQPGQVAPEACPGNQVRNAATGICECAPGTVFSQAMQSCIEPAAVQPPTAAAGGPSLAVPLLIGAAVVGAAALLLMG
jgi:hypothetical protein